MDEKITPSRLINLIKTEVDKGYGIVPLIGAGFSAPSGIPAGIDYTAYLFYCLARVFGTDGRRGYGKGKQVTSQWNPASLRWPAFTEVPIYDDLWEAMKDWSKKILEKNENISEESKMARWQAAGVVSDWRATLNMLSRIHVLQKKEEDKSKQVVLKYPDNRVIDSFFVTLTRGKKPNAAHMFLPHLADILRIKIILTTNFDNLIEEAFQQFDMPVAVFDVHLDASLPDPGIVRSQRSIVKMHGGRYGLRADFTLDKYPTPEEIEKFTGYVSQYRTEHVKRNKHQRNLIVLGVGGKEHRTIALICGCMLNLPELKLFWICYQEADKETVNDTFNHILSDLVDRKEITFDKISDCLNRIKIANTPYLSHFFLEFYQNIFLSLPPAGVQFPAVWQLPPMPNNKELIGNEDISPEAIIELIKKSKTCEVEPSKNIKLSTISKAFYKIATELHSIWLDIYPNHKKIDFAYSLIESCAIETGQPDFQPSGEVIDFRNRYTLQIKRQLLHIIQRSTRRFILFINLVIPPDYKSIDKLKERIKKYLEELIDDKQFYKDFQNIRKTDIRYIIYYHKDENKYKVEKWLEHLLKNNNEILKHVKKTNSYKNANVEFKSDINKYVKPIVFKRFLLALSLSRNINYISLLHTWAFIKSPESLSVDLDNDPIRYYMAKIFLDLLRNEDLILDDEGYYIYVPQKVKYAIQKFFHKKFTEKSKYRLYCSESHQGIADWHMKLYRASGDIQAVFEATYHRLCCIRDALKMKGKGEIDEEKFRLITTSLIEMEMDLDMAKITAFKNVHMFTLNQHIRNILKDIKQLSSRIQINNDLWRIHKLNSIRSKIIRIRQNYFQLIYTYNTLDGSVDNYYKLNTGTQPIPDKAENELFVGKDTGKEINKLYEEAENLRVQRCYEAAHECFEKIFDLMDFTSTLKPISSKMLNRQKVEDRRETGIFRSDVRKWIMKGKIEIRAKKNRKPHEQSVPLSQDDLKLMVKVLRSYQILKLFQAQIYRYKKDICDEDREKSRNSNLEDKYLRHAERVYICATEIMRYFKDINATYKYNALIRTNTGIMLSWMTRHVEAYRRYNEAYSYLNFGYTQGKPLEFAIIDLRRGETFLSKLDQKQYRQKAASVDIERIGCLFDAIACVERAEYKMRGSTIDNWWFNWLYEQQLKVCIEIASLRNELKRSDKIGKKDKYDVFARCRDCEVCGIKFKNYLDLGMLITGRDILRSTRLLFLSYEFLKEHNYKNGKRVSKVQNDIYIRITNILKHIKKFETIDIKRDPEITNYTKEIKGKVNLFLHNNSA